MIHKPVFSIIVPVYNVENYLNACVQSLINQTFSDIEIILVDDGSPDNCPAMCDTYAAADSRVHVVHQPNSGLSVARNTGLAHAAGSYVLLLTQTTLSTSTHVSVCSPSSIKAQISSSATGSALVPGKSSPMDIPQPVSAGICT